jgi:tetratricopeptide (TPR) repeat protein
MEVDAGDFSDAIRRLQKATRSDISPGGIGILGYAYGRSGDRAKAQDTLRELERMSKRQYISPVWIARVYIGLGEKQRALDELEKAYNVRSQWLCWLKIDRANDSIRSEPRFVALLKKVGLDK